MASYGGHALPGRVKSLNNQSRTHEIKLTRNAYSEFCSSLLFRSFKSRVSEVCTQKILTRPINWFRGENHELILNYNIFAKKLYFGCKIEIKSTAKKLWSRDD